MNNIPKQPWNRRKLVKTVGGSLAVSATMGLIGCGSSGSSSTSSSSSSSSSAQASNSPASSSSSSSIVTSSSSSSQASGVDQITSDMAGNAWARGGTAGLSTAFPPASPFQQGLGNTCRVTASYTLGPCYFSPDEYREDISEGELGVPMILVLKLVNANCQPIQNADIDIWHCNAEGLYSGNSAGSSNASSFNTGFCTGSDNRALNSRWFRGVQKTDSQGMAYFKSCFPGWYRGRTSHIHFKVVHNNVQSLVSQFCFEDNMSNAIYQNHADYTGQAKDTMNANDNVFGSDYNDYAFYIKKNEDNSMTAYKTIQIAG